MRYSPEHKSVTRQRILTAASEAFRERGVAATGVDEIMRRAGLTHGGFYAYFRDKAQLVAEASAAGFESAVPNLERIAALPTARARARALILSYLGPRHRDNPAGGCLVAALGAEAARLQGAARRGYSKAFVDHRDRFAVALRLSSDADENLRLVTSLLSLLVGALVLARAVAEPEVSDRILSDARRTALAFFVEQPAAPLKSVE